VTVPGGQPLTLGTANFTVKYPQLGSYGSPSTGRTAGNQRHLPDYWWKYFVDYNTYAPLMRRAVA
jgi:hypothetical protein